MGATLCRRRAPEAQEPEEPEDSDSEPEGPPPQRQYIPATTYYHDFARQRFRQKFGQSWRHCGDLKRIAKNPPPATVDEKWARVVSHRLFTNRHHTLSQTLKEIKALKRAELYQ